MPICNPHIGVRLITLVMFSGAIVAAAAEAPSSADDCVALVDRDARLACYDRAHGRQATPSVTNTDPSAESAVAEEPIANPPPSAPAPPDRRAGPGLPAESATPASDFGAEQLPRSGEARDENETDLVADIRAMGKQTTGRHWFRLENDQLWSQVSPERTTLRTGDSIRINRSLLGTYHLRRADGGSRSTAVRRLE
ncbi:MAG: hypothetical protein RIC56_19170 [Pseudomonadales bacterium]